MNVHYSCNSPWCMYCGGNYDAQRIFIGITPDGSMPVILAPKGWECPKCEAVMGPTIPNCVNCKGKKNAPT